MKLHRARRAKIFSRARIRVMPRSAGKRLIYGVLPDSPETPDDGGRQ